VASGSPGPGSRRAGGCCLFSAYGQALKVAADRGRKVSLFILRRNWSFGYYMSLAMMDANLRRDFNRLKNFSSRDWEALKRRQIRKYRRLLADEIARAEAGNLMTRARAEQLLMHHDSYGRLGEIMRFSAIMSRRSWLRLLGEEWTGLDNFFAWNDELRQLLPGRVTLLLMNKDERAAWRELPDIVTIYRGCSEVNLNGLSWSLCPEIASKFPTLARYKPPNGRQPLLVTAEVAKQRIIAVKLDRKEREIVTFHARQVAVEDLTSALAVCDIASVAR